MRREVLKSFSTVKVCLLSATGVGQQVSSHCSFLLLSREDYKVNSLFLALRSREVCMRLVRNLQEASISEHTIPSPCRWNLSLKVTDGKREDLLILVTAFLHFIRTMAFRKEEIPLLAGTADNAKKKYLGKENKPKQTNNKKKTDEGRE